MNISDLYDRLELEQKLTLHCPTKQRFYVLRTSIYRARKNCLAAFAKIGDAIDDGMQLTVRWIEQEQVATIELAPKKQSHDWIIIPVASASATEVITDE